MTATIDISDVNKPVIVITRDFDAPRQLVWKAITDPKQVAMWFGGEGFTNPICEIDLRRGGIWHHVMQAPNGTRYTINSVFEEVVEPERLVWRTLKDPNRNPLRRPRSTPSRWKRAVSKRGGSWSRCSIRSPIAIWPPRWASAKRSARGRI